MAGFLALLSWCLRGRPAGRLAAVALAFILAGGAGAGYGEFRRPRPAADDLVRLAPLRLIRVQATILTDPLRVGPDRWTCEAEPVRLVFPRLRPAGGKVFVGWRAGGPDQRPAGRDGAAGRDARPGPRIGDRVLITGSLRAYEPPSNPGQPDLASRAARRGVFCRLAATAIRVEAPSREFWNPLRAAADLRARAVAIVGHGLPPDRSALAGSLLFGTGAVPVDEATRKRFADLGLAHVLAASGMQVTLLLSVAMGACRAGNVTAPFRALIGIGLAASYCAMCGFAPSVSRSAWMSGLALVAAASDRPTPAVRTLWLSALALLAVDPAIVLDLGCQFSFLATWGLLTTARRWDTRLREALGIGPPGAAERRLLIPGAANTAAAFGVSIRLRNLVLGAAAGAVVTPLAALVWCLPLQLVQFGQLSAWSLPANLFAEILIVWLTYAGFCLAALGLIWDGFAAAAPVLVGPPIALLLGGTAWLHELPGAALHVLRPAGWFAAAAYAILLARPRVPPSWLARITTTRPPAAIRGGSASRPRPRRGDGFGPPLAALALATGSWEAGRAPGRLELTVLDVGQGDAIVVRTPEGGCTLVDAGPAARDGGNWDAGRAIALPALARLGCGKLDRAILSHPHDDHLGGMESVVQALRPGSLWDAGQPEPGSAFVQRRQMPDTKSDDRRTTQGGPSAYRRLLADVLAGGTLLEVPQAGKIVRDGGLTWEVLAPERPLLRHTRSDPNNNALVVRVTLGAVRILLAGDLEADGERRLLATGPPDRLWAEILKVPHHGSRYGSTPAFLAAVRPRVSLISAGARNLFGHPDPDTMARLAAYGPIYRTDLDGAIAVRSDGASWSVTTFKARE